MFTFYPDATVYSVETDPGRIDVVAGTETDLNPDGAPSAPWPVVHVAVPTGPGESITGSLAPGQAELLADHLRQAAATARRIVGVTA